MLPRAPFFGPHDSSDVDVQADPAGTGPFCSSAGSLPFPKGRSLSPGACALEKGNHLTFQRFLDTGSELTLVPGDPKCHCGPPVSIRHWGFSSGPAHSGPPGSPLTSCGYIPSYGVHTWNRIGILSNGQGPHTSETFL